MKGIVLNRQLEEKIQWIDLPVPGVNANEVLVRVKAAALNHRDEWSRKGLYPNLKDGVVLGSDGAGIVDSVGAELHSQWIGKEVIINPSIHWGPSQLAQGKNFEILGMPRNGTLAEYVTVPADRLHLKPGHLSWEEAAALPLAGLTAFRALVYQGQVKSGEKVLITGIGGGVAQFAAQFALALGAEVYVSSSSEEKFKKAISLGVLGTFNYILETWTEEALRQTGGFDLIIDGAAGDTLNQLIAVAKPGGRIVFYGATMGNPGKLEARKIFWNQLKIMGSTMGSDQDFEGMLNLVERHRIKPVVDSVFPLKNATDAFDRMKAGAQFGKIVLIP
ncbi:zinc-binding dehydrogenase [Algoriphagus sp. AK58]|uniref:zinc-binding dehydrogenase n=1 Tax=Algoriphagus sp. AK58 TaxID=1406877 RepID=UPI00164EDFA8|nr:zinc-binding dehydrogenase [Algoriphagus sp. AK58]MBC6367813.1 alcohol dehydrogenase [Algoriphagus sp. AK58]